MKNKVYVLLFLLFVIFFIAFSKNGNQTKTFSEVPKELSYTELKESPDIKCLSRIQSMTICANRFFVAIREFNEKVSTLFLFIIIIIGITNWKQYPRGVINYSLS